ncbi:MAG: DUF89 family protein [Lachnospiraceae bacterium]|nr:DUF89 family protein [Lachnospiraceae bacterium]
MNMDIIDEKGSLVIQKPKCAACVQRKAMASIPEGTAPEITAAFRDGIRKIVEDSTTRESTCVSALHIDDLYRELIGPTKDFTDINRYYNDLIIAKENEITEIINSSEDPFGAALRFSMTGNYIDFIALETVEDDVLEKSIAESHLLPVDPVVLEEMRNDVLSGRQMVYLTDNCGEIVFDKLFIKEILKMNPQLQITMIVRGAPIVNDAVMADAEQAGLTDIINVIGSGSGVGGTSLALISEEALGYIKSADFIISKGMGNFETLEYEDLNCYFIFLCKCEYFAERFSVPRLTGMVLHGPCEFAQ